MAEMESGELELRQIFEETTTRNVKAMLAHGNETRRLNSELYLKVETLEKIIAEQNKSIESLKLQLANVQTKLYSGGT
jgi:uncharacterized coiled-coil protein SlyX